MILEFDTSLFKKTKDYNDYNLNINQAIYITLCLNNNQNKNQSIHELLDRVSDTDIQELIDNSLLTKDKKIVKEYSDWLQPEQSFFEQFYTVFPDVVIRTDGTRGFLKANINKCKKEYYRTVGNSLAMHQHIIKCLNYEIEQKLSTGKMAYFKTMWKWLTNHEWEAIENELEYNKVEEDGYGTTVE